MIYITGDIHGDIDISKLNIRNFPEQKHLSKQDYLIICGDFGLVWDGSKREKYWLKWLSKKRFTTLFVDGNHENFHALRKIPTMEKFGGIVRQITPSIYHLERGQVFEIDGNKVFVMGGARSHDKIYRKENISWWEDEMPSAQEMEKAIVALNTAHWDVDLVITHCAPRSVQTQIATWYESDALVGFLERLLSHLAFEHWYFGHYHIDRRLGKRFTALYDEVIPVKMQARPIMSTNTENRSDDND